ncbi:P-loop NTPase family protein [Glutamicibacter sp. X7]
MQDFRAPLTHQPRRVLICGVTGAGKTTLARELSRRWALPYTEIDALYHGPNWQPREQFLDDVHALAAREQWVTEWQYLNLGAGPALGERADTIIWLDLPRYQARWRLLRRTVLRRLRRERLFNGNVERPLHTFFSDPAHNILRWEMQTHNAWRERFPAVLEQYPQANFIRLGSVRQVAFWLNGPAAQVVARHPD